MDIHPKARQLMQEFQADRAESYQLFLTAMLRGLADMGLPAYIRPDLELAIRQSYEVGYTDALIKILDRDMLKVTL